MVRNIIRAIVKAGEGRYTRDGLRRILESKDCRASGLYLEKVYYLYDEMNQDAQELLVYE